MIKNTVIFQIEKILSLPLQQVQEKIKTFCQQYNHVDTFILISVSESAFDFATNTINFFNQYKKSSQSLLVIVDDFYRTVPGAWQFSNTFYALSHAHGVNHWSKKSHSTWNSSSNKFLFLTGVADRYNRVGMLAKLYQTNLLDNGIFSFYPPEAGSESDIRCNQLSEEIGVDYRDLLNYCQYHAYQDPRAQTFEFVEPAWWGDCIVSCKKLRQHEFDIEPEWYSSVKIELVSETMFDRQSFCYVTEKSFKSIYHGIPFIVAGYPGGTRYLEDLGFKTFDKYCAWPGQDCLPMNHQRLEMIIDNIQSFIDSSSNVDQVIDDLEHNKTHLKDITEFNLRSLEEFLQQQYVRQDDIDQIVMCVKNRWYRITELGWSEQDWQHSYSAVKDPSWPDCSSINDIKYLSNDIITELQNLHHFVFELNNFSSANKG